MPLIYRNQNLCLQQEGSEYLISELVKEKTEPFYLYDLEAMKRRAQFFSQAFECNIRVHYAVKANNHPEILKSFASLGLGADIVSVGELREVRKAGFSADQIIFSGVGKSKQELQEAIEQKIKQINVESPSELERIGKICNQLDLEASVAWRMNPDVSPETHPYITTGFRENKFGMDQSFLPELKKIHQKYPRLKLSGLTMHIGSQIRDLEPFVEAIEKTKLVYESLEREGFSLHTFNVGGGLGIDYEKNDLARDEIFIQQYAQKISKLFKDFSGEVLCEPGRVLVGSFGYLLGQVQYIKRTPYKNFVILNTGMHHLMRPMLYQAHHNVLSLNESAPQFEVYDVVGPICESADVIGKDRHLPSLHQDDWLVITDVGAYGRVMASQYNSHNLPEEVLV